MEKINFVNYSQPAINDTNLNKIQDNTEDAIQEVQDVVDDLDTNKLDKTSVKDTYSTSATDTYSCNYVNGLETYSTSETRVGTWIDGKPIYRKVVDLGQIQVTTSEKRYDINIANPDIITSLDIMIKFDNGNLWYRNWHIEELSYKKSNNSILVIGNQTATFEKGYVVLEYTKTTD